MAKGEVVKGAKVQSLTLDEQELSLINQYATEPLDQDDVFTFKVVLCDNEIDRDYEVFPRESLDKMAPLFVGKTIIKDHAYKADNQVARIYHTEVVDGEGATKTGEKYAQLVAKCYMVKTENNQSLIAEIKAGIKKEVSVGCRIGGAICSVCGTDNVDAYCKHFAGREYDGKTCYFKFTNPKDAYEVSFVAVPAQPKAGVTKSYTGEEIAEKEEIQGQEDLIDVELALVKSFIFLQKGEKE